MNKLIILLIALTLAIAGCGKPAEDTGGTAGTTGSTATNEKPAKPEDALAGTWKVDMEKSVLTGMSDKEKAEGASIVMEMKADGTFSSKTGDKEAKTGTWTVADKKVNFKGEGNVPPEWTLADDNKSMSFSMEEGGQKVTIVMSKS